MSDPTHEIPACQLTGPRQYQKLIYLATPYSSPDPLVMRQRYDEAVRLARILVSRGLDVVSPIAHCYPIELGLNLGYERGLALALNILSRCDVMMVAKIPGWLQSRGVRREIELSLECGRPILYIDANADLIDTSGE
jgi:hypothetical protein